MKPLLLISLLGAALLAPVAQAASDVPTVTITDKLIELPSYHRMQPADYHDYIRTYHLSNGAELALYGRTRKMYAAIGGEEHEIVATASHTFVALDRKLKIRIELDDDPDLVRGDVLLYVAPEKQLAALAR